MGHKAEMNPKPGKRVTLSPFLRAFLAVFLILTLAVGLWFYRYEKRSYMMKIEAALASIARIKAEEIFNWRSDQLKDAGLFIDNPYLIKSVKAFISEPTDENRRDILFQFERIAKEHDYDQILLVRPDGGLFLSLATGAASSSRSCYMDFLDAALRKGRPVMLDLHRDTTHAPPHIAVVATIPGDTEVSACALVLISNAERFLYPLLRSWPVPSETAEIVLVRKEGDSLLVLSDLRHKPDAALNLRIPKTMADSPWIKALISGKTGLI